MAKFPTTYNLSLQKLKEPGEPEPLWKELESRDGDEMLELRGKLQGHWFL